MITQTEVTIEEFDMMINSIWAMIKDRHRWSKGFRWRKDTLLYTVNHILEYAYVTNDDVSNGSITGVVHVNLSDIDCAVLDDAEYYEDDAANDRYWRSYEQALIDEHNEYVAELRKQPDYRAVVQSYQQAKAPVMVDCDDSQTVSPTRIVWDNTGGSWSVIDVKYN